MTLWKIIRKVGYPLTWWQKPKVAPTTIHPVLTDQRNHFWVKLQNVNGNEEKTIPAIYLPPRDQTKVNICIVAVPGQCCTIADSVFIDRFIELKEAVMDTEDHCISGFCVDSRHITYGRDNEKPLLHQIEIDKKVATSAHQSNFDVYLKDMVTCLQQLQEQHSIDGFIFAGHSLGGLKLSALLTKIKKENINIPVLGLFCSLSLHDFFSGVWHNIQTMVQKRAKYLAFLLGKKRSLLKRACKIWFEHNNYQITFDPSCHQVPVLISGYPEGDENVPAEIALVNQKKTYPHVQYVPVHIHPDIKKSALIHYKKHNATASQLQNDQGQTELSLFCEFAQQCITKHRPQAT